MADPGGRDLKLGFAAAHLLGCKFESPRGHGCLSLVRLVLSGRGLCVGLIPRSEESYRVRCVRV